MRPSSTSAGVCFIVAAYEPENAHNRKQFKAMIPAPKSVPIDSTLGFPLPGSEVRDRRSLNHDETSARRCSGTLRVCSGDGPKWIVQLGPAKRGRGGSDKSLVRCGCFWRYTTLASLRARLLWPRLETYCAWPPTC